MFGEMVYEKELKRLDDEMCTVGFEMTDHYIRLLKSDDLSADESNKMLDAFENWLGHHEVVNKVEKKSNYDMGVTVGKIIGLVLGVALTVGSYGLGNLILHLLGAS